MSQTHVVLVDDHILYRETLAFALQSSPFKVVGSASNAHEAYAVIDEQEPELVVADFMLPDGNGISLAREVHRRKLRTKVLVLGRLSHPGFIREAIQSGKVGGFAHKNESLEAIVAAMTVVTAGEIYVSPEMRKKLEVELDDGGANIARLSAREREVMFLLLQGLSSKEIGSALYLSSKTVDAHRLHINRKLGVKSPAGLAKALAGEGLVVSS